MRYSDYLNAVSFHHKTVSYNVLAPKIDPSAPKVDKRLDITLQQSLALIGPYCYTRIMDQVKAVVPLAAYLILFQILILRHPIDSALMLGGGLVAVIVGLAIFMEGLNTGLMPFGTIIGDNLPKKASMTVVLIIIGMLGVGVTFAEPAIGALQAFGSSVDVNSAPYLYELLNNWTLPLVLMVGAGVGLAAILGTVRFVRGWSLKPMIYCALVPVMILTGYAWLDPNLRSVLGLAWDCGAVTTGPVTVPLVLSLGIGIANAAGKGQSSLSGFGVVTLASLFPILAVLILAIFMSLTVTPDEIREAAQLASDAVAVVPTVWDQTPLIEIVTGVRAILPLVLFLMFVLFIVLRSKLPNRMVTFYGLTLSIVGMCIFNVGLTYGLGAIGSQTGSVLPAAFMELPISQFSPIYPELVGICIVIVFAFLMGFGATLAEPALNALGLTVQNLTNGAFKKSMLMYSVATGVAVGIALGIAKLVIGFDLMTVLIPLYLLGVFLTIFSTEEFVNVAWDSAGVTTGPVTVPLVLAMGLGLGSAVSAVEGFGILSLASICPILAVLTMGLGIQYLNRTKSSEKHTVPEALL
ncbi:MAG TPA: DUF1538 domain-containing protein [Gammaproteobacteria bacterium]|jgi:hypothetical protein|nr:DUF1538 domain-containing protein [Gammaproteobacteria bacterium]MBT5463110.1 DUF1538 domain-containing protein [Gammaproteobacteria bacterium]MBT6793629.1 DUF1538 domain-containing protein [Gammaproteobacteria bacterium]HAJ28643.1 DUF1538 domain-containing protein [Gammaproteobacteria bacterium]